MVRNSATAQRPRAGEIVRKGSVSAVSLEVIVYVEPRVKVPQLVRLEFEAAKRLAADRELRVVEKRVVTRITTDARQGGVKTIAEQSPQAGAKVKKQSTIEVATIVWKYAPPLATYGVIPVRYRESLGVVWTAELAADRKSAVIRLPARDGATETVTATLIDDRGSYRGKTMLTYRFSKVVRRAYTAIRIPADGNGFGQLEGDGVWFFDKPGKEDFSFSTRKPTF